MLVGRVHRTLVGYRSSVARSTLAGLYRARVLVHSLHAQSSRASSAFFELRQGDIESTKLSIPKTVGSIVPRYPSGVQVRALIVFRRQMFGRIFAISDGVRAYFAPGPCAFARRGATREKKSARIALLRVLWT